MREKGRKGRGLITAGLILSLMAASATGVYASPVVPARGEKRNSAEAGTYMQNKPEKDDAAAPGTVEKDKTASSSDASKKDGKTGIGTDEKNKNSTAAGESSAADGVTNGAGTAGETADKEKPAEKSEAEKTEKSAGTAGETVDKEKPAEKTEADQTQEPADDDEEAAGKDPEVKTAEEAFSKFIGGTSTATYHVDNVSMSGIGSFDIFIDRKEYTLKEFLDTIQATVDDINVKFANKKEDIEPLTSEYAFLEGGAQPMMVLHISADLKRDSLDLYYIMQYEKYTKTINVVYGKDFWSRSRFYVNKAGVVREYGVSSAFEESYSYFRIAENGKVRHLYSASYDNSKAALSSDLSEWFKDVALVSYVIGKEKNDLPETFTKMTDYYTLHNGLGGDYTFAIEPDTMFEAGNAAYDLYKEDNIEITDSSTVIKAVLARLSEVGMHLEDLYAEKPEWKAIK